MISNLVICGLVLLALALICEAAPPMQLSGSNGQSILNQIAVQNNNASTNSSNNTSTNASANATLWNWGSTPVGYTLSKSGMLTPFEDSGEWNPSI